MASPHFILPTGKETAQFQYAFGLTFNILGRREKSKCHITNSTFLSPLFLRSGCIRWQTGSNFSHSKKIPNDRSDLLILFTIQFFLSWNCIVCIRLWHCVFVSTSWFRWSDQSNLYCANSGATFVCNKSIKWTNDRTRYSINTLFVI